MEQLFLVKGVDILGAAVKGGVGGAVGAFWGGILGGMAGVGPAIRDGVLSVAGTTYETLLMTTASAGTAIGAVFAKGKDGGTNSWGSKQNLINSASKPGKGKVTPIDRAFQKHANKRAGTFVGDIRNNAQNTEQGLMYLEKILNDPNSTFTNRNLAPFGDILDVRMPDGTGARWSSDGKKFIGLLEKHSVPPK